MPNSQTPQQPPSSPSAQGSSASPMSNEAIQQLLKNSPAIGILFAAFFFFVIPKMEEIQAAVQANTTAIVAMSSDNTASNEIERLKSGIMTERNRAEERHLIILEKLRILDGNTIDRVYYTEIKAWIDNLKQQNPSLNIPELQTLHPRQPISRSIQ